MNILKELLERSFLKRSEVKIEEIDEKPMQLSFLKWSGTIKSLLNAICPMHDEIDGMVRESTQNREVIIRYVNDLLEEIENLDQSIEVIKNAIDQGKTLNEKRHIGAIEALNAAIHAAYVAQNGLEMEEFYKFKNTLKGILTDFDRVYRKYTNVLRLYDTKNRTSVLKPEKFSL